MDIHIHGNPVYGRTTGVRYGVVDRRYLPAHGRAREPCGDGRLLAARRAPVSPVLLRDHHSRSRPHVRRFPRLLQRLPRVDLHARRRQ